MGGAEADGEVREQGGAEEPRRVVRGALGEPAGGRVADVEVTEYGDQDRPGEQRELDAATLGGAVAAGGAGRAPQPSPSERSYGET